MKILVYDVAAEDGGGMFVSKKFYSEVLQSLNQYSNIEWIFLTSYKVFESIERISAINIEWIKKSWLHRLYFEECVMPQLIKRLGVDKIISLQNTGIKHCKLEQYIYLHQSLQYCPRKFSFFNQRERSLAIRQRLICGMYKNGLKRALHIYVQTNWIKEATKKWINCNDDKITVVPVTVKNFSKVEDEELKVCTNIFFYPARAEIYKNHEIIVRACKILKEKGITSFKVLFTIDKNDNSYSQSIYHQSRNLPIEFIGKIAYEDIWRYYNSTILIFPSYLETCGLPLIEAKSVGTGILAADMPFSKEALQGYKNVKFFEYDNAYALAENMLQMIIDKREYKKIKMNDEKCKDKSLLSNMLEDIL